MEKDEAAQPVFHVAYIKDPKKLLDAMFPKARSKCRICGHDVNEDEFQDDVSRREYDISGLCQSCQDLAFALVPEEEED